MEYDERQSATDREHLKLLALFHYVMGGLSFLSGCVPILYVFGGLFILSESEGADLPPDGEAVAWFVIAFGAVIMLAIWAFALSIVFAGRSLQTQTRYTYCMVIGAILCLCMPLGTILGVFTIVVLSRPSVKDLFAGRRGAEVY